MNLPPDYVIVFTASWETFEDTLLFFHNDFQEALLRGCLGSRCEERASSPQNFGLLGAHCARPQPPAVRVLGIHVSQLNEDSSFHEYYEIQNDELRVVRNESATKPTFVHLLHFGAEQEIAMHRQLARRFDAAGIAQVNPYNQAVANCDSKFRMGEILRARGIPTPTAWFVSRFTADKTNAFECIRRTRVGRGLFLQPDRGTEGIGCVLVERDEAILERWRKCGTDRDLVIRERVGNLTCDGRDFVVRINVTYDGRTFSAESGYCMVGDDVVCAARGAVKRSANEVFARLRLRPDEIERVQATACDALRAVSGDSEPPRLAGIDLILERQESLTAYVIDINPRPVAVGSRLIGSDAIGLGDHYWQGIREMMSSEVMASG